MYTRPAGAIFGTGCNQRPQVFNCSFHLRKARTIEQSYLSDTTLVVNVSGERRRALPLAVEQVCLIEHFGGAGRRRIRDAKPACTHVAQR